MREGKALLRGDVAPFPDGWFEDIVGCTDVGGLSQLVARKFPRLWTQSGWWGHRLWRPLNLPRRWGAALRARALFRVRRLAEEDLEAYQGFCAYVYDKPPERYRLPDPERAVVFGFWAESGALVGSTRTQDARASSPY